MRNAAWGPCLAILLSALGCGTRSNLLDFAALEAGQRSDVASDSSRSDARAPLGCRSPSCASGGPGLTDCGANGECCCTSLGVEGGAYHRTYVNNGDGPSGEADPASVSTFRLDKYLVTVARFRQFAAAWSSGSWTPAAGSGKHSHLYAGKGLVNSEGAPPYETGWLPADDGRIAPTSAHLACSPYDATWTSLPDAHENLPINCVNWYEAYAFCIWDGGFLPSESEWEYAAAGGEQEREYPWGPTPPGSASQYAIFDCFYHSTGPCTGVANIAPVGTATAGGGRWGQLDMEGEEFEWTLDSYNAPYATPCADCAYLTAESVRVARGGGIRVQAADLSPPNRGGGGSAPIVRGGGIGFRCARTP